jgi:tRNA(Ile)-lysidine synthase
VHCYNIHTFVKFEVQLLETIHQVIQKYRLISPGDQVVVGVSGGADSLALLHVLCGLRSRMGFSIQAATLDHSLRGEESASDVRHVRTLCAEWGVPVMAGQVDVGEMARQRHLSIEAAARLARYDFLAGVAREVGATSIAVAHHANDQAETVLLRLLRGTGLHGLRGMSWMTTVPGQADLRLIRPFLQVTRAEIERYCAENGITARQDSSNQDTSILRNHLRLELLPQLEKINPQIQRVLARLADSAAVDDDYLQAQLTAIASGAAVTFNEGRLTIRHDTFAELHPALQRRFVLWAAEQLGKAESGAERASGCGCTAGRWLTSAGGL